LPPVLKSLLPEEKVLHVTFHSPTPEGYLYFGRNHPFVEQLCQTILANSVARRQPRAARSAVVRTREVSIKHTLLLFRCRNVIEERRGVHKIVAEEILAWGYRGTPSDKNFLTSAEAKVLMDSVRPSSDLSPEARTSFLHNELSQLPVLREDFDKVAEERSRHLVEAHERFSAFMDQKRFQVVYPVLPMDVLGVYVLLPDNSPR
jgi:hypothetical protein